MRARLVVGLFCALLSSASQAAIFQYVNWTTANPAGGTASGVITLPDNSTVNADFEVLNADGSPGNFLFANTNGGTNYWIPSTPYVSAEVENPPPDSDILALVGGMNQTYRVTLSEPIKDPIMAVLSMGQTGVQVDYDFDSPFTIVSQGVGFFGGTPTSLSEQAGDILRGFEGHGTIRFDGTFSTFSWTVPFGESWHGFTYGIRTTEAIEPTVPEPASIVLFTLCVLIVGLRGARNHSRLPTPR